MFNKSSTSLIYFKLTLAIFLSLFLSSSSTTIQRLSAMNILLPVCPHNSCKQVYATVKAEGGCFEWSVENPLLINIELVKTNSNEEDCVYKVIVSPRTNQIDGIAWLVATDKKVNEKFKCKIGFAEVDSLEISTRFDTNNVGELFELQVEARDSKRNLFSSLEGWSFNWSIENLSIVEVKKTMDENKKLRPKRKEVERQSYSDIILVRGKSVGQIKVKCNIMEKGLDKASPVKELFIVDPFFISPERVYIMPRSTISLQIKSLLGKKIDKNQMSNFNWRITDDQCGSISPTGEFQSFGRLCVTEILVTDHRISGNSTAKSIVHVVHPDQIEIAYIQTSSFISSAANQSSQSVCNQFNLEHEKMNFRGEILLIEGHQYLIKYYPFYKSSPVHFSKDTLKFDKTEYARSVEMEYCQSEHDMQDSFLIKPEVHITKRESIKAVLRLGDNLLLTEEKSVMIYSQIKIKKFAMQHFSLPYLGFIDGPLSSKHEQELHLFVSGGSSHYKYSSSKDEVIRILNNILLGHEIGASMIKVSDEENEENYDEIEVRVSEVKDLAYLEQRQEIEVNTRFDVSVIGLHGESKSLKKDSIAYYISNSFTNCTKILPNAHIEAQGLIETYNPNERENRSNMDNIKYYMEKNPMLFESIDRLYGIKSSVDSTQKEYLLYSNYGICGISSFKSKSEGIGNISYKFKQNEKAEPISSSSKASINIYKEMTLKHPKFDQYTEEIIKKSYLYDPYITKNISLIYAHKQNFKFELENGLNQWLDIKHEVSILQKDLIKLDNKKGEITCRKSQVANVEISYQAKESLKLPRPALSRIALNINCQSDPIALSIFLLSTLPKGHIQNIYQIPQGEINYFVGNNSAEITRVYGFDQNKTMILNLIQNDGNIKNYFTPILFKEISKGEFAKHSNQITLRNSEEFYQTYFYFNQLGKSKLTYQSTINPQVTHSALIDVIASPILEPGTGTIYVSDDNVIEFSIKYGSGEFNVSLSDDNLASFTTDFTNRKIFIRPKKTGELRIILTDIRMIGNPTAMATLYLADVKKITLIGGGLLMLDKSLSIGVEVIDTFDHVFPIEQLKKIHLVLDESFGIATGLNITYSDPHYKRIETSFNVTGISSGLYPITLTVSNIRSNTVTVEVFDKLKIFPPYLLLIPGSSYTLSITGGPQTSDKIIKRFSIVNNTVASIAKDVPEVTAKYIGETSLKIELIYNYDYHKIYNDEVNDKHVINKTQNLWVENVPVRIAFPTDIKIIGASERQVFTQSTIRLLTAFKLKNETFTYGIGKMKFKWEIQNKENAHIITFSKEQLGERSCGGGGDNNRAQSFDEACVLALEDKDHEDDSIGIFLQSKQEGMINILLNVNITYPDYYKNMPNAFNTAENVRIGDQVYVNINEFYGQDLMKSAIYMIPFDVDHELHTSKNTIQKYSLESTSSSSDSNTIIDLSDSGRITTNFTTGRAYVKITGVEKDKNLLPVVLPIYVTDFYSLFVEKTNILLNLEIGQELQLSVILQHDSGKLFAEKFERMKLKVVESHPKIARAELVNHSSKLKLKALSQGRTHIILFHPISRKIYDVFKITVSKTYHLGNSFTLNIGGTIQFMGNDQKKFEEITANSIWTSSDNSILTIDSKTGLATGKNEGVAIVQLKTIDEGIIKKMITVNVGKIQSIHVDRSNLPKFLTNIGSGSNDRIEYSLPIDFYTSIGDGKYTFEDPLNIINQNINFKCESTTHIARVFERKTNSKYECIVSMSQFTDQKSIPHEIEIKLSVSTIGKKEVYSITERFPFASSFNIKNNLRRLSFNAKGKPQKIHIDNMNDLEYNSQDRSLAVIDNIDKSKGFIEVIVPDSVKNEFHDIAITIKNTVTKQEQVVYISYVGNSKKKSMFLGLIPMDTIVDAITLILLLVIIIILVIYLSSSKEQPRPMDGTLYSNQKYQAPKGSGIRR